VKLHRDYLWGMTQRVSLERSVEVITKKMVAGFETLVVLEGILGKLELSGKVLTGLELSRSQI